MATIQFPRLLRIGGGSLRELPEVLGQLGVRRPLLITDAFMVSSGRAGQVIALLAAVGIEARVFDGVAPDPTEAVVAEAVAFLEAGEHDGVLALGGGSPIDTAKAVAVLALKGGWMRALKAPHQEDTPGLPVIAIPTTAGTGSEATRFTVITDEATDEKMLCAGLAYLPVAAVIDYELTLTMPWRLTADTGIDALTHAIEAYVSRKASPVSDALAVQAMAAIAPSLRTVCLEPDNRAAREQVMMGSFLAGLAFSNASVALVHGMSRPIGAHFHVPHGLSNAMLLPAVTAFSVVAALPRYAACARAMQLCPADTSDALAVERLQAELIQLNLDLKVPTPGLFGIAEADWRERIPLMARQALESGSPAVNPRIATAAEIEALYHDLWR